MRKILAALALLLAMADGAAAQICSAVPFTFTANTTIRSSQVNSNFSGIVSCVNGNAAPLASPTFTGTITGANEALSGTLTLSNNPLTTANGGTGLTTLTAHAAVIGNGASTPNFLAPGSNGNIAISNGTDWASVAPGNGLATSGSTVAINSAAKSDMQTATSTSTVVTPAQTQNHPGVAKAWVSYNGASTTVLANYNVSSVTKNGTGDYTINFTTSFSSANFACTGASTAGFGGAILISKSAGTVRVNTTNTAGTPADANNVDVACFGSQ